MRKIILLIIVLFSMTGCYDYQELNNMSVVDAIGIDYKNEMYIVSFEVIKSIKNGDSATISTEIVKATDEVLAKAINKAIMSAGKKVSLKHVKLLLVGMGMAKEDINPIIDYVIRDVNISTNLYTLVCEEPDKILETKLEDNSIGQVIIDTITYNVEAGTLDNIDIIASNIINKKIDIALPYIVLDNTSVIADKMAYFNDSSLIGLIDNKIYNFLLLDSKNIEFNSDKIVLNVDKKKIKYEVNKNEIDIMINGNAKVKEMDKGYNLKDKDVYEEIEKKIDKVIEDECTNFLEETLNNKADLLGLEDKYYKLYKEDKENIKFKVKVDIKINRNGTIYEVLNDK